jgi:beta-xylosidase
MVVCDALRRRKHPVSACNDSWNESAWTRRSEGRKFLHQRHSSMVDALVQPRVRCYERASRANTNSAEQYHPASDQFVTSSMKLYWKAKHIYIEKKTMNMEHITFSPFIISQIATPPTNSVQNGFPSTSHHRRNWQTRRIRHKRTAQGRCSLRDTRCYSKRTIRIRTEAPPEITQDQTRNWRLQRHQRHLPQSQGSFQYSDLGRLQCPST